MISCNFRDVETRSVYVQYTQGNQPNVPTCTTMVYGMCTNHIMAIAISYGTFSLPIPMRSKKSHWLRYLFNLQIFKLFTCFTENTSVEFLCAHPLLIM